MTSKPHFTMKDVARLAGVSVATVSAVINGSAVVSEERTKRVRSAMEALDYQPDAVARSLKTGRTLVVGVVIPDITNAFFADVIRGAEDSAAEQKYSVIVCNTNEDAAQEQRQLAGLMSRRADGLLISCSKRTGSYDHILRHRIPVVFMDQLPHEVDAPLVATDNFSGGYAATQHLIGLGHEHIAIMARNLILLAHSDRVEGYRRAMQQAGLPVRDEYFRVGGNGAEDGYAFGLELLRLDQPPTAIFSANNKMLAGLLRALRELDVRCPEDVSVVGFDDHIWLRAYRPPITTVTQKAYDIGHLAMTTLLDRLSDKPLSAGDQMMLMQTDLMVRGSTCPPRAQGRKIAGGEA